MSRERQQQQPSERARGGRKRSRSQSGSPVGGEEQQNGRTSKTQLYVGQLSRNARRDDLMHEFEKFGQIRELAFKGRYAFVDYEDPRDAERAFRGHATRIRGDHIVVEFAKTGRGGGGRAERGGGERGGKGPTEHDKCWRCHHYGHWATSCPERRDRSWSRERDRDRKEGRCFKCGRRGHKQRDCRGGSVSSGYSYRSRSYDRESRGKRRGRGRHERGGGGRRNRSQSYSRSPEPRYARHGGRRRDIERRSRSYSSDRSYNGRRVARRSRSPEHRRNRKHHRGGSRSPSFTPSRLGASRSPRQRKHGGRRQRRASSYSDNGMPSAGGRSQHSSQSGGPRRRSRSEGQHARGGRVNPQEQEEAKQGHGHGQNGVGQAAEDRSWDSDHHDMGQQREQKHGEKAARHQRESHKPDRQQMGKSAAPRKESPGEEQASAAREQPHNNRIGHD